MQHHVFFFEVLLLQILSSLKSFLVSESMIKSSMSQSTFVHAVAVDAWIEILSTTWSSPCYPITSCLLESFDRAGAGSKPIFRFKLTTFFKNITGNYVSLALITFLVTSAWGLFRVQVHSAWSNITNYHITNRWLGTDPVS